MLTKCVMQAVMLYKNNTMFCICLGLTFVI